MKITSRMRHSVDFTCPPDKSIGMMLHRISMIWPRIESTRSSEEPTWYTIKTKLGSLDASNLPDDADFTWYYDEPLEANEVRHASNATKEFVRSRAKYSTKRGLHEEADKLADDILKVFETLTD